MDNPHFFNYRKTLERQQQGEKVAGYCTKGKTIIKTEDVLEGLTVPKYNEQQLVLDYLGSGNAEKFIADFFELFRIYLPSRFFKNANESTYHVTLYNWLNMFKPKDIDVDMEKNMPGGEADIVVKTNHNTKIRDIFELKYIKKSATKAAIEKELKIATEQVKNYMKGKYANYRGIAVVFVGNESCKFKIVN